MAILNALERAIVSENLRPGDRLPTHRELASQLGLAIGTVTKAYREAERLGLIAGDGRRGTFVGRRPRQSETFPPLAQPDPGIIDLSKYYPPNTTDPDLRHALTQLTRRETRHLITYSGPKGYDRHRAAGAKWVASLGLKADQEDVVITYGAQHAILLTMMALAKPGDIVATEKHTYPGIKCVSDILGLRMVGVESDDEGMLPDSFASCCSRHRVKFLYLVPTLHNPTNATLPESRRQALAEIARKHEVKILEDEINRRLVDNPPPLISSLAPERSYLIASLSKVIAGGLRICYLVPPKKDLEGIYRVLIGASLQISPLLAELAAMWITDGTADRTVAHKMAEAKKRSSLARDILKGLKFNSAPSSYFIWLKLPEHWHRRDFAAETRRRGVIVAPADIFAVDSDNCGNAARICLGGHTDTEILERGLKIVASVTRGGPGSDSVVI
ncbi:MAG: PLP-dependent aminotransferase family protein [Candidatus Zixiibacteriota bacterium]|nr:MAG: PLP-dependent aminotransferase family protein [candidate division Zixibacteria bacterium]